MKIASRVLILSTLFIGLYLPILAQQASNDRFHFKIAKLKYDGGGDWYANPTSLPNLIDFVNQNTTTKVAEVEDVIEAGGSQIYQYPYVYMTGHGNVIFSDAEATNLRNYLISGGFLHIDDNYGMDKYIRKEIKKVFPELDWVELPFDHPIYDMHYAFPNGLPKIHEHDNKPPQGFALIFEGRVVVYYTCLLYTSPSPRDRTRSRMPSSA